MKCTQGRKPVLYPGCETTPGALRPGLCGCGNPNSVPDDVFLFLGIPGDGIFGDVDGIDLVNLRVKWRREEDKVGNHSDLWNWRGRVGILFLYFR